MTLSSRPLRRAILTVGAALLLAPPVPAQRVAPPPPPTYDVRARYRITAARNERIAQFFQMVRYLESIGFRRAPGPEDEPADPLADRLQGTLPSDRVRDFLLEPHIRTVLLIPSGLRLPDSPDGPVLVQIRLGKVVPERQLDLFRQTIDRLASLGFVPKVGF